MGQFFAEEDNKESNNVDNVNSSPKNKELIINDAYEKPKIKGHSYINAFNVFKSINNILYLIYSNKDISIISFNLINDKKLNEIKRPHKKPISSFRNYIDEINHKELLMSISESDNNIKIWNIRNLELIYNFKKINEIGSLYYIRLAFLNIIIIKFILLQVIILINVQIVFKFLI